MVADFSVSVVVVDDERTFLSRGPVTYFRTDVEALGGLAMIWTLQQVAYRPPLEELWLDHDLGDGMSAMRVVEFLDCLANGGNPLVVRSVFVHSMNPDAAATMVALLNRHYPVERVPLPPLRADV